MIKDQMFNFSRHSLRRILDFLNLEEDEGRLHCTVEHNTGKKLDHCQKKIYRVFIKYCVFSKDFNIFLTQAFLCFSSVSV